MSRPPQADSGPAIYQFETHGADYSGKTLDDPALMEAFGRSSDRNDWEFLQVPRLVPPGVTFKNDQDHIASILDASPERHQERINRTAMLRGSPRWQGFVPVVAGRYTKWFFVPRPVPHPPARPLAKTRLYFQADGADAALPLKFGVVVLAASEDTSRMQGEAARVHKLWPYFFEVDRQSFDDAHKLLHAFVTAIRLSSDVHLKLGHYAIKDDAFGISVHDPLPKLSASAWGHYGKTLDRDALHFAQRYAPRLAHFSMRQSFNRVSNAIRLYESALDLIPSDVALVVFVSVLEGLFSTATQELSYRLALSVSAFLAASADERLTLFKEVRDLYTLRSKVVHGDRVHADEEQTAIQLAENYVPRIEEIVRRALRTILEQELEGFIETTKHLDEFYQLLVLGFPADAALERLGFKRSKSAGKNADKE